MRVDPRNRNVTDPQVALMTSSQFQDLILVGRDDAQCAVFIIYFFQYNIGLGRLLDCNYLVYLILVLHSSRQLLQTELALKFLPLVGSYVLVVLRDHFVLDPFLKTNKMYEIRADARVHFYVFEWVFAYIFHQTIFATVLLGIVLPSWDYLCLHFMELVF